MVHFEPPKSPNNFFSCEAPNQTHLDLPENVRDGKDFTETRKEYLSVRPSYTLGNKPACSATNQAQRSSMTCTSRLTPRSAIENQVAEQNPMTFPDTRVKDLLKAMDENFPGPMWHFQEKDSSAVLVTETLQFSPLPRLRQVSLKEPLPKKISWMGLSHQQPSASPPVFVTGSRPPIFPITQQQTFIVRSLRQSRESKDLFNSSKIKRNFVQLKPAKKDRDLNLPILSLPYQSRSGKKSEILRFDFT